MILQDDRGTVTSKVTRVRGAYLHWFCEGVCFTAFNSLGVRIEKMVVYVQELSDA